MFRIALLVFALIAAGVGLVIGTLNPDTVSIDLLAWRAEWPLGLALVAAFVAGLLGGLILALVLFGLPSGLRRARRQRQSADSTALRAND